MSNCKFCGLTIWFDASRIKMIPRNEDGRDHRETCISFNRNYRNGVRDQNHEELVKGFMSAKGQRYRP